MLRRSSLASSTRLLVLAGCGAGRLLPTAASRSCPANTRSGWSCPPSGVGLDWTLGSPLPRTGFTAPRPGMPYRPAPTARRPRSATASPPPPGRPGRAPPGPRPVARLGALWAGLPGRARVGTDLEHLDRAEPRLDVGQCQREVVVAVVVASCHDRGPHTAGSSGGRQPTARRSWTVRAG